MKSFTGINTGLHFLENLISRTSSVNQNALLTNRFLKVQLIYVMKR